MTAYADGLAPLQTTLAHFRAVHPDVPAEAYPILVGHARGVSVQAALPGSGGPTIERAVAMVSVEQRIDGAVYLGPVAELPDVVVAVVWVEGRPRVWLFSPETGHLIEAPRFAPDFA